MSGFQGQVNLTQAPGVAGDFASANPRASALATNGGLVAGAGGVTVGKFAWIDTDGVTVYNRGTATRAPDGFVHREQQALITQYLGEATMVIPQGFPVTLMSAGDYFAKVTGATAATQNATVYADYFSGDITIGAAATGASVTAAIGATSTASLGSTFTATGTGTSLAVTSVTGYLSVGDTISGTGVPVGTTIVAQVSGTAGAAGTYTTSVATTASAATVTSFGTVLNVTAVTGLISIGDNLAGTSMPTGAVISAQLTGTAGSTGTYRMSVAGTAYVASASSITMYGTVMNVTAIGSGTLYVGAAITGTGVPSGAVISSQITGTANGVGTYGISIAASAYAASTTVTATNGVLTNFKAKAAAAVGELTKISTWG